MNFQELAQKIRRIDEGAVVECGDMMAGHMPQPMPQQDTVSMNVSMNATGKGGIRDLMQVLQNIENGVTHGSSPSIVDITPSDMHLDAEPDTGDSMMGGEVEIEPEFGDEEGHEEIVFGTDEEPEFGDEEPEMEPEFDEPEQGGIDPKIKHAIAPVVQAVGLAHALGKDPSKVFGGDKATDEEELPMPTDTGSEDLLASEEYANRPNTKYQSQNYMTKTLAGGADEPQRMTKHGYRSGDNPLAMKEGLQDRLANLYQTVKLRESAEKKTMSRAAKGHEKYGKEGMQALAKAGKEGKDLDKVRDKYNKYDESAKWRDPKHKDKLYTQEPRGDDDDYYSDDDYYNPKPDDYPGAKHLKGGGEFDHNDPLRKGYGRHGTGSMNTHGKRKGMPSRDQVRSLKGSIKAAHGTHPRPNLPK